MKVWSAVKMYGGIIQDMAVFPNMKAARNYFYDFIESNGEINDCDPDAYEDANGFFYWNDGSDDGAEIMIWPAEMEMEG